MRNPSTLLVLIASPFICADVNAQGFQWSTTGGAAGISNSYLGAMDIARDPSGNLYLFNDANTTQQCQGITAQPQGGGGSLNTFVHKFNAAGDLQWIRAVGPQFQPFSLECDDAGNLYLLGRTLTNTIVMDDTILTVVASQNHLLKFHPDGDLIWHFDTGMPLTGGLSRTTLLHHSAGRLYFQSGNLEMTCIDTAGTFIATLAASSYTPQTAFPNLWFKSAVSLSNGDVVVAGEHRGALAFGSNPSLPGDPNAAALNRYFFLRLGPELDTLHWFRSHGSFRDRFQYDIPLIRDGSDNIYASVTLNANTPITFGPDQVTSTIGNGIDAFIKMDEGGTPLWMRPMLPSTTNSAYAYALTWKDDDSGLLACGQFFASITFGNITMVPGNTGKGFIAEVAPDGTFVTGFASGTSVSPLQSWGQALATNGSGEYLIAGFLNTLSPWELSCAPVAADRGFYLASFNATSDSVPTPVIALVGDSLIASPAFTGDIQWFLDGSPIAGADGQATAITANGDYSVTYTSTTGCTGTASSSTFLVTTLGLNTMAETMLVLRPNPTNGPVILSGVPVNARVSVLDATGRVRQEFSSARTDLAIELGDEPAGMYMVRMEAEGKVRTMRLLKH
ncbi:MAG: T9SS type A sorting domain-containing protein [Flavobacteriales bacterium]|nr:T9SS type A sorting domain-containing protein [Flavobacteriales bacterium]